MNIHEAKTNLPHLVSQTLTGKEAIIANSDTPVVPSEALQHDRVPGSARGTLQIAPTFDDPLPEEILSAFEGR